MNIEENPIKIKNNENNPNSAIKAESDLLDLKEPDLLDEKVLLKEQISLLPSDKADILSLISKDLQNINMQKITIENLSSNICDKIFKYRNLIVEDIFQLIYDINHFLPKLEYLCLINEIITRNLGFDKSELEFNNIMILLNKKLFPYIKGICSDIFYGLDRYYHDAVLFYLKEWENNKHFKPDFIKEIKFELMMRTDPEISGNKEEINYLKNLVNCGGFKIEQGLIDFSRQYEALQRNKDNIQRKIKLKIEKDLIQKQVRMYNTHIQQLKEINLLLNKIKDIPHLFDNKH